ncbi:MAG: nucleotide kinase domain-containing protein [Candidatus Pacearchaeota archaeon]|jgi:hypothetical protein
MKNKPKDILYCNVSKEKIISSKPVLNEENIALLYHWIFERYNIHIKKDIEKKDKPWTQDLILQNYRFCNVRREHDKESRWLIENIINSNLSYENKLLNIILFRLINKSQTIKIFGILDFNNLDFIKIKKDLEDFKLNNPDYIYFSNAFFTSGPKVVCNKYFKEDNMVIKMIMLVLKYYKEGIIKKINNSINQKEVFNSLKSYNGLGNFLAYQIFVDFTYMKEFPYSENEFVISGPGCINGLKLIFKDFDGLNYDELLFYLRDNQFNIFEKFSYQPEKLFKDLIKDDQYLNLMSLENCMCEISKYIRALKKEGRPRIKYKSI